MAGGAYLIVDRIAVLLLCLYFLAIDLAVLCVICLFQDVIRWKWRKIAMDLWRAQKENSSIFFNKKWKKSLLSQFFTDTQRIKIHEDPPARLPR